VLLSPHVEDNQVRLYVVSDRTEPLRALLRVRLLDFDGRALSDTTTPVEVSPLASKVYQTLPLDALLRGQDPSKVFLHCELSAGGRAVSSNNVYFRPFKDLSLPAPNVAAQVLRTRGATFVTLSADRLARAVHLSAEGLEGSFAENFFDLLPGQKVSVVFRGARPFAADELRRRLRVRTLSDAFAAR
jgi:beta-mannosidase